MRPLGRVFWQKKGIYAILRPLGAIFCHERYGQASRDANRALPDGRLFPPRRGIKIPVSKEIQRRCLEGDSGVPTSKEVGSHRLDPRLEGDSKRRRPRRPPLRTTDGRPPGAGVILF